MRQKIGFPKVFSIRFGWHLLKITRNVSLKAAHIHRVFFAHRPYHLLCIACDQKYTPQPAITDELNRLKGMWKAVEAARHAACGTFEFMWHLRIQHRILRVNAANSLWACVISLAAVASFQTLAHV